MEKDQTTTDCLVLTMVMAGYGIYLARKARNEATAEEVSRRWSTIFLGLTTSLFAVATVLYISKEISLFENTTPSPTF